MKKVYLTPIFFYCIVLLPFYVHAKGSNDSTTFNAEQYKHSIDNAFSLAKEIGRLSSIQPTDDNKEELKKRYQIVLGKVMWYANLQDSSIDLLGKLSTAAKKYAELDIVVGNFVSRIAPFDVLFAKEVLFTKPIKFTIADTMQKLHAKYWKAKNNFERKKNEYIEATSRNDNFEDILKIIYKTTDSVDNDTTLKLKMLIDDGKNIVENLGKAKNILNSEMTAVKAELKELYNNDPATVNKVLLALSDKEIDIIINEYKNPETLIENAQQQQSLQVSYKYEISSAAPGGFSMPSEAQMIDAVAIYLAKRIKQESVMWFFETITKNANNYELIRTFFPNTLTLLGSNEVYDIPNLGVQWRYALAKDFVKMPPNILNSQWLKKRMPEIDEYRSFIDGTCNIAEMLLDQRDYRGIVQTLYMENLGKIKVKKPSIQFGELVDLLYAINIELSRWDTTDKQYKLLRYEDFRLLTGKEIAIMVSLIDMKYDSVICRIFKGMETKLDLSGAIKPEDIRLLFGKIERGISEMENTRKVFVTEAKKISNGDVSSKQMLYSTRNMWNATNSLLGIFSDRSLQDRLFSDAVKNQVAFQYTGQLFDIYDQISKRNYAGAVSETITLIDSLFYRSNSKLDSFSISIGNFGSLRSSYGNSKIFDRIMVAGLSGTDDERSELMKKYQFVYDNGEIKFRKNSYAAAVVFNTDRHAVQLVRKLAGFLNDVALSENSKDLAKVVESNALPAGSYKRKRNNWQSWDVNAYAGIYGGTEILVDKGKFWKGKWEPVYGFSVPIGLSYSKTFGKRIKKDAPITKDQMLNPNKLKLRNKNIWARGNSTWTATLSIFDIGAVVSYRLLNSDTAVLPQEVRWEQFVSPGFSIGYGFPNTPLIIKGGLQYTPLLRRIEQNSTNDKYYNACRAYIGIFYDLPLLNVYESRNRRRFN